MKAMVAGLACLMLVPSAMAVDDYPLQNRPLLEGDGDGGRACWGMKTVPGIEIPVYYSQEFVGVLYSYSGLAGNGEEKTTYYGYYPDVCGLIDKVHTCVTAATDFLPQDPGGALVAFVTCVEKVDVLPMTVP